MRAQNRLRPGNGELDWNGQGRTVVTLVDSIRTCFQKYFDFSGRASRPEFWWFFLCSFVAQPVLGVFLPGIAFLVLIAPFLAVSARRLHDTGRSAWWLTSYLVSGVGSLLLVGAAFALAFAAEEPFSDFDFETTDLATFILPLLLALAAGLICGILPLVLCALPGTAGPNLYGPDPLSAGPEPDPGTAAQPESAPVDAARSPAVETPQFCVQCGASLVQGAKFCAGCGAAV